jgi:hypothetical protein
MYCASVKYGFSLNEYSVTKLTPAHSVTLEVSLTQRFTYAYTASCCLQIRCDLKGVRARVERELFERF